MKKYALLVACLASAFCLPAAEMLPIEKQVADVVAGDKVTVVHFWAPWCQHCGAELKQGGWQKFIEANSKVNFIFVTTWSAGLGDGREILAKNGVGPQKNFQLLFHPNEAQGDEKRMKTFLGLQVNWLPTTWVFRAGKQRYALNYGEVRFPLLQQLVEDAQPRWD